MAEQYIFEMEIAVRDYELDSEGIVNNANYLHYLEYTRHEFCASVGISFKEMQLRGITPVLNKVEIEYKNSLRSGDVMVSKLWIEISGPRFLFYQDIFNKTTGLLCVHAIVSCVCLENGKLSRGVTLAKLFEKYLKQ
ncbi:MAG: acyl-CoA thioesterase [Muribaculaceae bacterium]|nr:acyl-CoA thioesterase [Muribaculaceae bacterium]